jgi:hypothetical protein
VSRAAVATRLAGQELRASQIRPKLDLHLAAICDRALAVDPAARFATADELRVALEDYLVQAGQRVDAATIKQVLGQKFAAERRAIHGLIDRHIKQGVVEESLVHSVALGTEAGNNQPTQVADLTQYVRSTTNETVVSAIAMETEPARRWPSPRTLALCAVAAVAALGLTLGLVRLSAPDEEVTTSAAEPRPAALAPAPGSPPTAAATKPAVGAASSKAGAPATSAAQDARPSTGARPGSYRTTRPRPAAAVEQPLAEEQPALPPAEEPPAREEPPAPVEPRAVEPAEKISVGADLNSVEKAYPRRTIDTDL